MPKTVLELRDELNAFIADGHGDLPVKFSYNYGDHWRTQVAPDIDEVELGTVKYSDYHSMDKLVENEPDYGGEKELKEDESLALILS